jgi:hypothetical protein
MSGDPELDAMARRAIHANHYMTPVTRDPDARPRLSPVYYTPARYTDFYWVSSPNAHRSRNLAKHPEVAIVIFDSTAAVSNSRASGAATVARLRNRPIQACCSGQRRRSLFALSARPVHRGRAGQFAY